MANPNGFIAKRYAKPTSCLYSLVMLSSKESNGKWENWTNTSNKESGALEALRSASRTVAETCTFERLK